MQKHKSYAIVPAAGRSRRMGEPKLLLPWWSAGGRESGDGVSGVAVSGVGGDSGGTESTVIESVLGAWTASCVVHVVVVVRQDDVELQNVCRLLPVEVITPRDDPTDMKESIQVGLRHLNELHDPAASDRCFIAPADLPTLEREIIDAIADAANYTSAIVAPKYGGKQSHPVLLPWSITNEIFALPADKGINEIVERHAKTFVHFEAHQLVHDIDTRERYLSLLESARPK